MAYATRPGKTRENTQSVAQRACVGYQAEEAFIRAFSANSDDHQPPGGRSEMPHWRQLEGIWSRPFIEAIEAVGSL
jgi:hypothetical protein